MISFSNLCPFLPPALLSAQPDLCAPSGSSPLGGMSVLSLCQTRAALLQRSAAIKKLDFFFIAAELSWGSGGELNLHTLPPSRGRNRRRLQQKSVWHQCWTGKYGFHLVKSLGHKTPESTRLNPVRIFILYPITIFLYNLYYYQYEKNPNQNEL